ncbi:MAG TPA: sulfur carrier protein ThiS [Thermoanaerobaculia bacterium]|nr:sulfur carrier protein ThiS [Thermoanaerobaculia bacterium]
MTTTSGGIRIEVNGATRAVEPEATVLDLVRELGLELELVAVEINRELVRRSDLAGRHLAPGDRVEIVEFVGGG